MKKKIKDITIGEIIDLCSKISHTECYTGICPLDSLCTCIQEDIVKNVKGQIIDIYEREVEL